MQPSWMSCILGMHQWPPYPLWPLTRAGHLSGIVPPRTSLQCHSLDSWATWNNIATPCACLAPPTFVVFLVHMGMGASQLLGRSGAEDTWNSQHGGRTGAGLSVLSGEVEMQKEDGIWASPSCLPPSEDGAVQPECLTE
ncbi:hypothetical protein KIL84_020092 [Mauremys mutica]|uniref:Uncharacterized protein n=1 Tax=Mauremys mutica TaxID=74926 RepID=A0A9D3XXU1_9SAUR|nr:hypothetical protein KIL84_020092 [Mauremys mutica]